MIWLTFIHPHRFWWFCFSRTLARRTADVQQPGCMGGRQRLDCMQPSRGWADEPYGLWPRTFGAVNRIVVLLGWRAGNGLIWTLLEVFQVRDPFLVYVGLALVQFQHWLNLQRQIWRRELGWKCAGECSPGEKRYFFNPSLSRHWKGQSNRPAAGPGAWAGRFWPDCGCGRRAGPGHAGSGWREGRGSFRTNVAEVHHEIAPSDPGYWIGLWRPPLDLVTTLFLLRSVTKLYFQLSQLPSPLRCTYLVGEILNLHIFHKQKQKLQYITREKKAWCDISGRNEMLERPAKSWIIEEPWLEQTVYIINKYMFKCISV